MARTRIMQNDELGFAIDEDAGEFVLVDTSAGDEDVDQFSSRTAAIDAFEKALAEVRRDRARGA